MKKKYIEARKTIETRREGEFEFNKIHVLRIDDDSLINSLENLAEEVEDDWEWAYSLGFVFDLDGFLYIINVNNLTRHLKEEIKNKYTDEDDKENYKLIINSLKKLEGYDLYFHSEDIPEKNYVNFLEKNL